MSVGTLPMVSPHLNETRMNSSEQTLSDYERFQNFPPAAPAVPVGVKAQRARRKLAKNVVASNEPSRVIRFLGIVAAVLIQGTVVTGVIDVPISFHDCDDVPDFDYDESLNSCIGSYASACSYENTWSTESRREDTLQTHPWINLLCESAAIDKAWRMRDLVLEHNSLDPESRRPILCFPPRNPLRGNWEGQIHRATDHLVWSTYFLFDGRSGTDMDVWNRYCTQFEHDMFISH